MWNSRLLSRRCCGGPVLAMTLLCIGFGALFMLLSAYALGLAFIAIGALAESLCFALSRSRCQRRYPDRQMIG